jgi:hypothetical protein
MSWSLLPPEIHQVIVEDHLDLASRQVLALTCKECYKRWSVADVFRKRLSYHIAADLGRRSTPLKYLKWLEKWYTKRQQADGDREGYKWADSFRSGLGIPVIQQGRKDVIAWLIDVVGGEETIDSLLRSAVYDGCTDIFLWICEQWPDLTRDHDGYWACHAAWGGQVSTMLRLAAWQTTPVNRDALMEQLFWRQASPCDRTEVIRWDILLRDPTWKVLFEQHLGKVLDRRPSLATVVGLWPHLTNDQQLVVVGRLEQSLQDAAARLYRQAYNDMPRGRFSWLSVDSFGYADLTALRPKPPLPWFSFSAVDIGADVTGKRFEFQRLPWCVLIGANVDDFSALHAAGALDLDREPAGEREQALLRVEAFVTMHPEHKTTLAAIRWLQEHPFPGSAALLRVMEETSKIASDPAFQDARRRIVEALGRLV